MLPARVAFVAGTLGRGGAERQLFYMLRSLLEAGVQPSVACLTQGEHWEDVIRDLGVEVLWFGRSSNPILRIMDLIRVLRPLRAPVFQSAHFHTNLYTIAAARALGAMEVGAIRGDTSWSVESLGAYGKHSLRLPRHLAVNSLAALEGAVEQGVTFSRVSLLPNVVDVDHFQPSERRRERIRLISVGRFVEVKRHDRFLRAVRSVQDSLPEVEIEAALVGEGPLEGELRELAATLGVDVEILANPSMPAVYGEASILVLTSDNEGTPNVVLEAMASGVPVVAFAVGGVPDLIPSADIGRVIRMGDQEGLVRALVELCTSATRREAIGAAARAFIEEQHSPDALTRYLSVLYDRVCLQRAAWRSRPEYASGTMLDDFSTR